MKNAELMELLQAIPNPPVIMRSIPNWVVWNYYGEDKRKIPFNPRSGDVAKTNDPRTWGTWAEAAKRYLKQPERYNGLGFIFAEGGGLFGVDLDGCIEHGEIKQWAWGIMSRFQTYTELSPSATGIKIFGIGNVPTGIKLRKKVDEPKCCDKNPGIEVYGRLRLFCFTGACISVHKEIHECQGPLTSLLKKIQPAEEKQIVPKRNNIWKKTPSVDHAREWLSNHGPAISGSDGHTHTFRAALALVDGFALDDDTALRLLQEWNQTCAPPWSERDLIRKIQQAKKR